MKTVVVLFLIVTVFNGGFGATLETLLSPIVSSLDITLSVVTDVVNNTVSTVNQILPLEIITLTEVPLDLHSTDEELKTDVMFLLYGPSNPKTGKQIYVDDEATFSASSFDVDIPTRILIHGYLNNAESPAVTTIRDAYLSQGDYNVIIVDWSTYTSKTYTYARSKVFTVGQYIGQLMNFMEKQGLDFDDLIVVGHSLGAHVAGVACRSAENSVPLLIALDPAGPLFYTIGLNARMSSTDAEFVQVVHSNAGALGHLEKLGDVDLWPNGGTLQPGCGVAGLLDVGGACAHGRSFLYFAESIANPMRFFRAYACDDYLSYSGGYCISNDATYLGGIDVDKNAAPGNYYFSTNSGSAFARND